jgi:hypothetical protein
MQQHELREAARPALPTAETPSSADIVSGRGRLANARSGNVSYWDKATIQAKTSVTQFNDSEMLVSLIATCRRFRLLLNEERSRFAQVFDGTCLARDGVLYCR